MKKKKLCRRIAAFAMSIILLMQNQGVLYAAENEQPIQEESSPEDSVVIDEETGLKMQTLTLEEDGNEEYSFDMNAHLALADRKNAQQFFEAAAVSETGTYQLVQNNYVEFSVKKDVYDDITNGRFTIGTVKGNPNYNSDDNQILLFGHPMPWSSFTTIRINGMDYIFHTDDTTYDAVNKKAVSSMTVAGVKIIQTLQIVNNESTNLEDTVRISYATVNQSSVAKHVGIRIMLDTMLGSNDGAPFKVPSQGEVTKELELTGNQVPAYWQAFDSLTDPTVFAIGTIYKDNRSRKPDKVQFASWTEIYETMWDYVINSNRIVTNDSAVAFYWNPITLAAGSTTTVETYYGVGLSLNEGGADIAVNVDLTDKYVVLVTKNSGKEPLAGATVKIDGVGTAVTDENGNAVFSRNLPINSRASMKQITINCNGYRSKDVFRLVSKDRCSAAGLVADNGKPYIKSVTITGSESGNYSDYVDLMSQNYTIEADSKDESSYYKIKITATGNGNGNVNRYKIIQNNDVIAQEDVKSDSCTFTLQKKKLEAGYRVYVQIETDKGTSSEKTQTTLLVNAQKSILREDSKDTKGSIKLGGSEIGLRIPDDVVAFGGMELNMDLPGLPIEFEAFDDGTVKVSIGSDKPEDSWEDKEKEWDELISKYEKGDDLQSTFNNYQGTTSWNVAGDFEPWFICMGYAEGKIDDYGNCNVDLMLILGIGGEYEFTKQYIVGYIPLGFEFTVGAKGTYSAGGKLRIGSNSVGNTIFDFTGNKGKMDVDIYAVLYGGLGLVGVLTVGGEGEAHLLLGYDFAQQYYDAKVKGSIALSAKAFMFSAKYVIAERTWNLTSGYSTHSLESDRKSLYEVLYNANSYSMMSRDYLSADVDRKGMAVEVESFFQNVYPGASQRMVVVGDVPYMFWITDDITRSDANRTCLVYSKYVGNEWVKPVAVEDDGTADFNFDVAVDGTKIHIVWQDMAVEFSGSNWENMSDADKLTEMSKNSDISYACLDTSGDTIVSVKITDRNGCADMLPKITINNRKPYATWYTNEDNDILTQRGENSLNIAEITYGAVSVLNQLSDTEESEEPETEEPETGESETKETETVEPETEESKTGESETKETETEESKTGESETEEFETEGTDTEETNTGETNTRTEINRNTHIEIRPVSSNVSKSFAFHSYAAGTKSDSKMEESFQKENIETEESYEAETSELGKDSGEEDIETGEGSQIEDSETKESPKEQISETDGNSGNEDSEIKDYPEENSEIEESSEEALAEESDIIEEEAGQQVLANIVEKEFVGTIRTIRSLSGVPIVSVNVGNLGGKLTVAYILDNDKDLNTIEDHELYLWNASSGTVGFSTSDKVCDENPQFAADGSALYWYADGQIYYVANNSAGATLHTVVPEGAAAASSNFSLTNKNSVIWTGVSVSAMDITQYNVYKSDKTSNGYSVAYRLITDSLNSIGEVTAIEKNGQTYVAYIINYMENDAADIAFEKVSSVVDLTLENVDIDYTSVEPGTATDFELSLVNKGSSDISKIEVEVLNTDTNELASWTETVALTRGESVVLPLSHAFVGNLSKINNYLFFVTAVGESENRLGDNAHEIQIGYTDVSVTSSTYYSDSSYFSNVLIQNNTGMPAHDVVLRVHADEEEGAILYEKSFGTLTAYQTYALQLDLFSIAGSSDIDELYITVDTSSEEYIQKNNTEMEYLHFLWREEEAHSLYIVIQKEGGNQTTKLLGNYYSGDVVKIKVDMFRGYDFAGWSTSEGGYFYDSGSRETNFSMPNSDTTITANFISNAFLESERTIAVGESLLIAPVYAGVWKIDGDETSVQIKYSENVAKVTGLKDGKVTLKYTGASGQSVREIKLTVYSLDSITILSDHMADGTLKIKPSDTVSLGVKGTTNTGKVIELPNVTWSVVNSKIADIDDLVLTARKKGTTLLTAQVGAYKTSISLEVKIPVSYISVVSSSKNNYVPIGETVKLKAQVTGYGGNKPDNSKLKWESTNNAVATVNSSGTVTGHAAGAATITASAVDGSGVVGYYSINITGKVKNLVATTKSAYGYQGQGTSLVNYISISSSSGSVSKYAVKWKSSNANVVSVSGTYAYLKNSGTATLTGSYDGKSVKIKISVREYVAGIRITGANYMSVGSTTTLKAKPVNSKAYDKNISWSIISAYNANGNSVSTSQIASISNKGKISAHAAGYVVVRAAAQDGGGAYMTKRIEISHPVKSIEWSDTTAKTQTVVAGSTISLKTLLKDTYGDTINGVVTYTSSNTKVASLEWSESYLGNNIIYANAKGSATIKASYGGKSVSYTVKVIQPVTSIRLSGSTAIPVGQTGSYKVTYYPASANTKKVDWTIVKAYDANGVQQQDVSKIAVVDKNGKLNAIAEGQVTICATAKDGYGAYITQNIAITNEAGSIELSETDLTIRVGSSSKVTYNLLDQNGLSMNDSYIEWKSSNPKVAEINKGLISTHKKGTVKITASYGGKQATVKVNVVQPVEEISITGNTAMTVGQTATYKASVLPTTTNNKKVEWIITKAYDVYGSDVTDTEEIATISNSGRVKAVSCGTVYVKVFALDGYGADSEIKIKIYGTPDQLVIAGKSRLTVGEVTTLTATVFDSNMDCIENSEVKWSSKDKKIIKVDAYGKITAMRAGMTTITAKCGKQTATYDVIVK